MAVNCAEPSNSIILSCSTALDRRGAPGHWTSIRPVRDLYYQAWPTGRSCYVCEFAHAHLRRPRHSRKRHARVGDDCHLGKPTIVEHARGSQRATQAADLYRMSRGAPLRRERKMCSGHVCVRSRIQWNRMLRASPPSSNSPRASSKWDTSSGIGM